MTSIATGSHAPSVEKTADLGVVDFRRDARAPATTLAPDFTAKSLLAFMKATVLNQPRRKPPQQVRTLLDHLVGGEDDVRVEVLLDVAEQEDVAALALLLELVAGRRFDHHAVELAALHGGQPRRHRAERHDLDAVRPPALLAAHSSRVSQSVSEPSVVTPMLLPLRSATVWIDERGSTASARLAGGPYMAATPIAGTPLARKPRPGPEPTATSTAPAGERLLHLGVAAERRHREARTLAIRN